MVDINFRRPLNTCFLLLMIMLIAIFGTIVYVQQGDIRSNYERQAERYVRGEATLIERYLLIYEQILTEFARRISEDDRFEISAISADSELRQWFSERLRSMPDAVSIVYADEKGGSIHFPVVRIADDYHPKKTLWYQMATGDGPSQVYYSNGISHLDNDRRVLTLSVPVVGFRGGEKKGVLAYHLDADFIRSKLSLIPEPLDGEHIIIDMTGELSVITGNVPTELAEKLVDNLGERNVINSVYIDNDLYIGTNIGKMNWLIVYKIPGGIFLLRILDYCTWLLWGGFFSIIGALICWWSLRNYMDMIYIHIASGIRKGNFDVKSAEQVLYDEIRNNVQQKESIKAQSLVDSLTELKNRRAFDNDIDLLDDETQCCIALIDIDNFKSVNDAYGHLVGDMVLKFIADTGMRLRGLEDINIYRYGGEEIAVLFPRMSCADAFRYLDLWRSCVSEREFRENSLRVTFSAGLCVKKDISIEVALERADEALYKAKNNGKNQVHIAS